MPEDVTPAAPLGDETENEEKTKNEIKRAASAFGRMGGIANAKKHDHEHFVRIGKIGGERVRAAFAEKTRSHHKKNDQNNEGKNGKCNEVTNEESVE